MNRRSLLLVLACGFFAALLAFAVYSALTPAGLPFSARILGAHTVTIEPIAGIPLPEGLHAGDSININNLDSSARAALYTANSFYGMQLGITYQFKVRHGMTEVDVPVTTVNLLQAPIQRRFISWALFYIQFIFAVVALLALWKGRDRAAFYLLIWGLTYVIGDNLIAAPPIGGAVFMSAVLSWAAFFVGRWALYGVAESLAGDSLSRRARAVLRIGLALILAAGFTLAVGGAWLFIHDGWAGWLNPSLTWVLAAPYLLPVLVLLVARRRASGAHRRRLQWMLWSLVPYIIGILARDINVLGFTGTLVINSAGLSLGLSGILYAILRHRVVDVRVVIDKTLVYGLTTSLVVGVLAAANGLVQHAALGAGASLLLQILVPLSLGILIGRIRKSVDQVVEWLFFRKKLKTTETLKRFGRECAFMRDPERLRDALVTVLEKHIDTHAVALYEMQGSSYMRTREHGTREFPTRVDRDDGAFLAAQAGEQDIDLAKIESALGHDAYVFPLALRGVVYGALVCASRPGQRFAPDERELLVRLAHQVVAALQAVRARESDQFIEAVAAGSLTGEDARNRARELVAPVL
ncbi:MAG: GAF domain-containing protein [Gammaproteobacteria bacterium]